MAPKAKSANFFEAIKQAAGLRKGSELSLPQIEAMLKAVDRTEMSSPPTPREVLAALSQKTPGEWREWMQANPLGDTPWDVAQPAKPAAKPAAKADEAAGPAAGKMTAAQARKRLEELEMPKAAIAKMSDAEAIENATQLEAQLGQPKSDGRGTGPTGRRNKTLADRVAERNEQAASGAKPAPGAKPAAATPKRGRGGNVVDTAGEVPESRLPPDPASMSSRELKDLLDQAIIREGLTPNAQVRPALQGTGVADVSDADMQAVLAGAPKIDNPFPQSVQVGPNGTDARGRPVSTVDTSAYGPARTSPYPEAVAVDGTQPPPDGPANPPEPPRDWIRYPEWWSKQANPPDETDDGWLKMAARRPHVMGPLAAAATLAGYGIMRSRAPDRSRESDLDALLQAQRELRAYFDSPRAMASGTAANPADQQHKPEDTIRRSQGKP